MSTNQRERQASEHRTDGRYAKVNPCEACGKSAGVDYFSNPHTCNLDGNVGLVLCKTCALLSGELLTVTGMRAFIRAMRKAAL